MSDLFQLLKALQGNPEVYLGRRSLHALNLFLNGYVGALARLGLEEDGIGFTRRLSHYLWTRFGWSIGRGPIASIREAYGERDAWDQFFVLASDYQTFLKERGYQPPAIPGFRPMPIAKGGTGESVFQLIASIEARPEMFLGSRSYDDLLLFLKGDAAALEVHSVEEVVGGFLGAFGAFARAQQGSPIDQAAPLDAIRREVGEEQAWDRCLELLHEFRAHLETVSDSPRSI